MKFLFWKKREYPIKRDESGRSLRSKHLNFLIKDIDHHRFTNNNW